MFLPPTNLQSVSHGSDVYDNMEEKMSQSWQICTGLQFSLVQLCGFIKNDIRNMTELKLINNNETQ